jgi:hypothetical protein
MTGSAAARRIVFHIGLERTGTTWLQYFCFQNRRALADNAILYPWRNLGFRRVSHVDLAASYLEPDASDYFVRDPGVDRRRVVESLAREIESSRASTVLLSSEFFSSRLRRPHVEALRRDFADFDCKVVIFLRGHVSRFFSTYATHVASGGRATVEDFADEVLHPDNPTFRYADAIAPWEEAFGKANLDLRVHERGRDVVGEFFGEHGPTPVASQALSAMKTHGLDPLGIRRNHSLGPDWTNRLRATNVPFSGRSVESGKVERAMKYYACFAMRGVMHLATELDRRWRGSAECGWSMDPTRFERLMAMARADESWLSERYGVSLGGVAGRA